MITTEEKIRLCGIDFSAYSENSNSPFDMLAFNELIDIHAKKLPQIKEYEIYLWKYGNALSIKRKRGSTLERLEYIIKLLENAKFLLDNKTLRIRVLSKAEKNVSKFFDKRRYVDSLLAEIDNELKELGFNKIDLSPTEVFSEIEKGINKDWIDNFSEILWQHYPNLSLDEYEWFMSTAYSQKFAHTYSVRDEEFLDKKTKELNDEINSIGNNNTPELILHKAILVLSYLLRIDNYIKVYSNDKNSIDKIPISNKVYNFIYDFLIFFSIYDKPVSKLYTTEPYGRMRSLNKNFPKNSPEEYDQIIRIKFFLDITIKKMKEF